MDGKELMEFPESTPCSKSMEQWVRNETGGKRKQKQNVAHLGYS